MDLLALADFTLVARHGGFGKAARAARRPKATPSRRVGELDAALNLRLFERGRRDLRLTEEGRTLFERAGALLTELEETAAAIASGSERVRVRHRAIGRRDRTRRGPRWRCRRYMDDDGWGGQSAIKVDPVLRLPPLVMIRDAVRAGGARRLPPRVKSQGSPSLPRVVGGMHGHRRADHPRRRPSSMTTHPPSRHRWCQCGSRLLGLYGPAVLGGIAMIHLWPAWWFARTGDPACFGQFRKMFGRANVHGAGLFDGRRNGRGDVLGELFVRVLQKGRSCHRSCFPAPDAAVPSLPNHQRSSRH
jgi:DNA-binding transcriptional LysR family regulator